MWRHMYELVVVINFLFKLEVYYYTWVPKRPGALKSGCLNVRVPKRTGA